ncbi:DNA repair protein SWI5 homolog [Ruditapes philippinarum]|uniref:DNA repair protein SWI5 homolog n=1 Tax=Ruditapes philippinarum TaxID=129788 RepID=UPI00295ADF78|nr:DNA repair protein SWI5 homolog [Ruditapes philippinarum]
MSKAGEKNTLKRKHQAPFKSPFQKDAASRVSEGDQQTVDLVKDKLKMVDKEIEDLKSQGMKEAELQIHIDKLHEYNEIKDVGQLVLGRLANLEGVRSKDLYDQYGLNLED